MAASILLNAVLAMLAGYLLVRYLVTDPLKMSRDLAAAVALGCATVAWWILGYEGIERWLAVGASLISAIAGYAAATWRVLSRADERPVPALTRARGDAGHGHTAVVYITHGEPERYDPIGWINQFREFDEQGVRFVPFLARPLFLHKLREKYLEVGRSDHRRMHERMVQSLERLYREAGDADTRFYLSFLDDNPRPDAALIQALNEGASRVVVAIVLLTVSNHSAEGEELVRAAADPVDVPLLFTEPLWNSPLLQQLFVERANAHLGGTPKERAAVLLVGHGQPEAWDRQWPTETAHEIAFREGVLDLLAREGYRRENLAVAWMEFREPQPAPKLWEFSQNGVEKVLYFSAAISAESIHSQWDVPALMASAPVARPMEMVNLGAWNDDPWAIRAIKARIDERLAAFEEARP